MAGKPLPNRVDYNPYGDSTTHKMNQESVIIYSRTTK